jgi:predicted AlkP superfamily pyrophosphatase or phosphodiesterase
MRPCVSLPRWWPAFVGLLLSVMAVQWQAGRAEQAAGRPASATLVLVSFDGFRADYLDRFPTPNLDRLIAGGVRAEYLKPVFPTKTYPNHYTIVTGLYPDHHGMVANDMWDPVFGRFFDRRAVGTPEYDAWWGGEPIWVTARRQGRRAVTVFWPGSDAAVDGVRPDDWLAFDPGLKNEARVDRLLHALEGPETRRPAFATLYLTDTDDAGHRDGPDSSAMGDAVAREDAALGRLMTGLASRGLAGGVDVIVVSDHGMAETPRDQIVFLDEFLDPNDVMVSDWTPLLSVWPKPGRAAHVLERLRAGIRHATVYERTALPSRWHFGENRRVAPILVLADEGWTLTTHARRERARGGWNLGNHGFDNDLTSMRAIFVASGPHFKRSLVVPPIGNIHLYELMCRVLDLTPAPNDGSLAAVDGVLADPSSSRPRKRERIP